MFQSTAKLPSLLQTLFKPNVELITSNLNDVYIQSTGSNIHYYPFTPLRLEYNKINGGVATTILTQRAGRGSRLSPRGRVAMRQC